MLESDITSLFSPLPYNEYLTTTLKMKLIFQALRDPNKIWIVLYFLFLMLFKGSETAEGQMLHASF